MSDGAAPQWWQTLPPAQTEVACGEGPPHAIRWENGALTLPAHADTEAELVLAALGGGKPRCVELAELWARHHDDLDVLAIGPRWDGDEVPVGWDDVEAARSGQLGPPLRPALRSVPMRRALAGMSAPPQPVAGGGFAYRAEVTRARARQAGLLSLLALGPAFQMRLTASVAAAWRDKTGTQERPDAVLTAALTGRLALVVESWLGIDADLVTARPHRGPGWGEVQLTRPSAATWRRPGHRLHASLPVDWLASVWAAGLALVGRHLVVAVQEASWPEARVLALTTPGAAPVTLTVCATGGPANARGGAHWEITDAG